MSSVVSKSSSLTPVPALVAAGQPSRMTHAEELQLGSRLSECRKELLAIALVDPASSTELERISADVAGRAQRIEAVVDSPGASPEAMRQRLETFREDVARARAESAGVLQGLDADRPLGAGASGAGGPDGDAGLSPTLAGGLHPLREVVNGLPLQWDAVERMLRNSWIRADGKATAAAGRRPMPPELRQRVSQLQTEIAAIINRFVTANQGLVAHVVQRYRNLGLSRDDLMQDGNIGLLRGVEKFDPRRGAPFSSYALWWIREAVRRALADHGRTIRLPVHAIAARYRLGQASKRLSHELGREPSEQELARASGVAPESVAEMLRLSREPISLDAPRGSDGDTTLGSEIPDRTAPSATEHAAARERAEHLDALLADLSPRERQVLRLRFGLDGADERTLEEIGRSFDLTRERVRQIVAEALGKLQRQTRRRHLDL